MSETTLPPDYNADAFLEDFTFFMVEILGPDPKEETVLEKLYRMRDYTAKDTNPLPKPEDVKEALKMAIVAAASKTA